MYLCICMYVCMYEPCRKYSVRSLLTFFLWSLRVKFFIQPFGIYAGSAGAPLVAPRSCSPSSPHSLWAPGGAQRLHFGAADLPPLRPTKFVARRGRTAAPPPAHGLCGLEGEYSSRRVISPPRPLVMFCVVPRRAPPRTSSLKLYCERADGDCAVRKQIPSRQYHLDLIRQPL